MGGRGEGRIEVGLEEVCRYRKGWKKVQTLGFYLRNSFL